MRPAGFDLLTAPMELCFEVENFKCGGCARSIEKTLRDDARVTRVDVDPFLDPLVVEAAAELPAQLAATLARLGYSKKGSVEGLRSAALVAKSVVGCAIGRPAD